MAPSKSNDGGKEKFSWKAARAKSLLTQTQIERLAALAVLCLGELPIDWNSVADELGQASPGAVRTAIFEIKKKLRDGGAVLNSNSTPASPAAATTKRGKKADTGKKRVRVNEDEEDRKARRKRVRAEDEDDGHDDVKVE